MLNIEKRCFVINLHILSESAYNILVNLNTHWAYKDCQFNNCFLVKIAGSFPFGAVVHGTCIYTYAKLSGLFHVHITAKSVNRFPTGLRKFTPPTVAGHK